MKYLCASCDELHEGLPELSVPEPVFIDQLPPEKRQFVSALGPGVRVYEEGQTWFGFVRGQLVLPVIGSDEPLRYSVWSTISAVDLQALAEGEEGPWPGRFNSALPGWPNTLNLKVMVRVPREIDRAQLTFEPAEHPLVTAQREGLTQQQAIDLVTPVVALPKT